MAATASVLLSMSCRGWCLRAARSTPPSFEMVETTWHMVLPIFVARQIIRTRTANVNEYSLRYSEPKDRFWLPNADGVRLQGSANKQGGDAPVGLAQVESFIVNLQAMHEDATAKYETARRDGVSRELARVGLPVSFYTEWYWKIDLHNLLRTLSLRLDAHAQAETRAYAEAMYTVMREIAPLSIEAFDDYDSRRGRLQLSRLDIAVRCGEKSLAEAFPSDRELTEFIDKMRRINDRSWVILAQEKLDERRETKIKAE